MHTRTLILLENYSLGLNNYVYLSTTFYQQRSTVVFYSMILNFLYFKQKNSFLTFFIIIEVNVFLHLCCATAAQHSLASSLCLKGFCMHSTICQLVQTSADEADLSIDDRRPATKE